ncbi:hypothetical protein BDL_3532 [Burkholderia pseudomallei MSHR305]|nr:hypothetical protein BDL_3532 [Burkholderia pseudomallei MSHR305]
MQSSVPDTRIVTSLPLRRKYQPRFWPPCRLNARQLWLARSSSVLGRPCRRKYSGVPHTTRRFDASFTATKFGSTAPPIRIDRS